MSTRSDDTGLTNYSWRRWEHRGSGEQSRVHHTGESAHGQWPQRVGLRPGTRQGGWCGCHLHPDADSISRVPGVRLQVSSARRQDGRVHGEGPRNRRRLEVELSDAALLRGSFAGQVKGIPRHVRPPRHRKPSLLLLFPRARTHYRRARTGLAPQLFEAVGHVDSTGSEEHFRGPEGPAGSCLRSSYVPTARRVYANKTITRS